MNNIQIIGCIMLAIPLIAIVIFVIFEFYVDMIKDFKKDRDPAPLIGIILASIVLTGFVLMIVGEFVGGE